MGYPFSNCTVSNSVSGCESAQFLSGGLKQFDICLLVETAGVMIAAILAVGVFSASSISWAAWLGPPAILVAAALLPMAIRKEPFPKIGLNREQARLTVVMVCWTCVVIFPILFIGMWWLKSCGLGLPLPPVLPRGQGWICWLFYQFMYVAAAEEVFFRGYVQNNVLELLTKIMGQRPRLHRWTGIAISAACFAATHIIVYGKITFVLTFLPGLVLGWLFIRTKSLLAPILFHGLANTCYCIMAAALA